MIPNLEEAKRNGGFDFPLKRKRIKFVDNPKIPFISNGGIKGIFVSKLFFEEFTEKERVAILWHEYHHKKFWYLPLKYELKGWNKKDMNWEKEYQADEYSAKINSIHDCLSYLKICKKLYDSGKIKYTPLLHPPIEERIKRIEKLNKKCPH